jgi:hypothetical protein
MVPRENREEQCQCCSCLQYEGQTQVISNQRPYLGAGTTSRDQGYDLYGKWSPKNWHNTYHIVETTPIAWKL